MKQKLSLPPLFFFICLCYNSRLISQSAQQNVRIECEAPDYIGKEVRIFRIDDYLSNKKSLITKTQVTKDSLFNTSFYINKTKKIIIEIGHVEAVMYVSPNSFYEMYFPSTKIGGGRKLGGNEVSIYFNNLDTIDVNFKILSFHNWIDDFLVQNNKLRILDSKLYRAKVDTLFKYAFDYYKNEKDVFVKKYVTYHLAQVENLGLSRKLGDQKLRTFARYFKGKKIQYDNDQYMLYFDRFFDGFLKELDYKIENKIYLGLLKSSPTLILKALKKDIRTIDPRFSELVLIKILKDNFYSRNYPQNNILNVLDSIKTSSKYKDHRKIAFNVRTKLTKLKNGFPAPPLNLKNENGKLIKWTDFKGKFVYLNFFDTKSETAEKEMNLYPILKDKYGDCIHFVSVCVDKDTNNLYSYLEKYSNFNWTFLNLSNNKDLLNRFDVKSTPIYFLINPDGLIVSAPALSPSPNGKYETIDKTFYYIKRNIEREKKYKSR